MLRAVTADANAAGSSTAADDGATNAMAYGNGAMVGHVIHCGGMRSDAASQAAIAPVLRAETAEAAALTNDPETEADPAPTTYTVKAGDSVAKIAAAHGIADWHVLYEYNKDRLPAPEKRNGSTFILIHPGDELLIPPKGASGTATATGQTGANTGSPAGNAGATRVDGASRGNSQLALVQAQITQGENLIEQYEKQLGKATSDDARSALRQLIAQTRQDNEVLESVRRKLQG